MLLVFKTAEERCKVSNRRLNRGSAKITLGKGQKKFGGDTKLSRSIFTALPGEEQNA